MEQMPLQRESRRTASWLRDMVMLILIAGMAITLLPVLGFDLAAFRAAGSPAGTSQLDWAFSEVMGLLTSVYLLPALGMALAIRSGCVDLSVWAIMGLGGVLAATLINMGVAPSLAVLAAILACAAIGTVSGIFAARLGRRGFAVTILVAFVAMWVAGAITPQEGVSVPENTFVNWHLTREVAVHRDMDDGRAGLEDSAPKVVIETRTCAPLVTRSLYVGLAYSLTMGVLVLLDMRNRRDRPLTSANVLAGCAEPGGVIAALTASGALSGAAGALWLIEHSLAPAPAGPIGDLRVVAAVVLAGAWLLKGSGRVMLVCLALPTAVLLVSLWRQEIGHWPWPGSRVGSFDISIIWLTLMVLTIHACLVFAGRVTGWRRWVLILCCFLSGLGVVATASQAMSEDQTLRRQIHTAGMTIWLSGLGLIALTALKSRKMISERWSRDLLAICEKAK